MIPRTPRGFKDVLPVEAAWRLSINETINERFKLWGYLPVETPTLELLDVLEMDGALNSTSFKLFDADNKVLVLRPDGTLPVARLTALRLSEQDGPFRLCYAQPVFGDSDSTYGQNRQVTQTGIEFIGARGPVADAEVLCLLFEALQATGLQDFTVAIGTVGVLNALVDAASDDPAWKEELFSAFHKSDFVAVDRLAQSESTRREYASAIAGLARIRGGKEAFAQCRELVAPLGCEDGLDALERTFDLLTENVEAGKLMVDFSIISSFDYYTGMVFQAYAPNVAVALARGGRYDHTLESFGRKDAAAGFAIVIEELVQALEAQGVRPPRVGPETAVFDEDPSEMFKQAKELRAQGKRVVLGDERS